MALNLAKAAARHRRCAEHLADRKEQGEACYLIGLAAECAIKYHLIQIAFPLVRSQRASRRAAVQSPDPLYLHFPDLITELLAQGEGILRGRILSKIRDRSLLSGWHVRMRYQDRPSSPQVAALYDRWHGQTDALFAEFGL